MMKKGDKWNWAFVTTALVQMGMYGYIQNLQMRFAAVGGYHHNAAMGIALLGLPFLIAPVLFVVTGIAAHYGKSSAPLVGAVIGLGLYFPLLVLPWRAWPASAALLLALGLIHNPSRRKADSNQQVQPIAGKPGSG